MNAKGVDVSYHQGGTIDWQQFRANGISFCFLRASRLSESRLKKPYRC